MNISPQFNNSEFISFDAYLAQYGITDKKEFLKPTGKYLDSCYAYSNMNEAIQMIKYHYLQNNTVYILSDSGDTDGITSTSILYDYFKLLNPNWKIIILIHEGKERGLADDRLFNKMKDKTNCLLIIPDAGTNDKDRVKAVFDNGVDVLCIDHHNLDTPIEQGILISNKKGDKDVSPYGSGCLVTHKVLQALDKEFNVCYSKNYIDMVALSLVSDIMNMSDMQNRTYYYFGLETFKKVKNPFLKQLIKDYIGDRPYTQRDISFKIVPKLNAVSRCDNQKLKQQVFKAFIGLADIEETSKECNKAHAEQLKIVKNIVDENIDCIDYTNNLIIVANDTIRKTYAGLVASKLSNGHPIIVGRIHDDTLIGSFRSPIDIDDTLVNNPLIDWKRGHTLASGISLPSKNIQPLVDYYNQMDLPQPSVEVLQSYTISEIPHDLFEDFTSHPTLYGKGFEKPLIHVYNIVYKASEISVLKNNTIKLKKKGIEFMWFRASDENIEKLTQKGELNLEVVGTMEVNTYNNMNTHQIIVSDYEIHENSFEDLM